MFYYECMSYDYINPLNWKLFPSEKLLLDRPQFKIFILNKSGGILHSLERTSNRLRIEIVEIIPKLEYYDSIHSAINVAETLKNGFWALASEDSCIHSNTWIRALPSDISDIEIKDMTAFYKQIFEIKKQAEEQKDIEEEEDVEVDPTLYQTYRQLEKYCKYKPFLENSVYHF